MKRVVIAELASEPLEAIERARLVAMEPPDPSTLAAHDVVIAVRAAAVGWVDLLMTSGQYQHHAKPLYTPGLEYAGEVTWVGAEVSHVAFGDRVLVDPFLAGPRSLGAYQAYGGFASTAVAPADAVHRIPGTLDFAQACNLLGNFETAYHCLITRGKLQPGETVLIHGASGATGLAAVQLAKLVGATVIATGRSEDKLAVVAAQGADHVIRGPFRDAVRRQEQPEHVADQPHHDEGPRRAWMPDRDHDCTRSSEPRPTPRPDPRLGRGRKDPAARLASLSALGVRRGTAREVEQRAGRRLRGRTVKLFAIAIVAGCGSTRRR